MLLTKNKKPSGKAAFTDRLQVLILVNWLLGMNQQSSGDELFYSLSTARYTNQEN
jgi:hypothetical protein